MRRFNKFGHCVGWGTFESSCSLDRYGIASFWCRCWIPQRFGFDREDSASRLRSSRALNLALLARQRRFKPRMALTFHCVLFMLWNYAHSIPLTLVNQPHAAGAKALEVIETLTVATCDDLTDEATVARFFKILHAWLFSFLNNTVDMWGALSLLLIHRQTRSLSCDVVPWSWITVCVSICLSLVCLYLANKAELRALDARKTTRTLLVLKI